MSGESERNENPPLPSVTVAALCVGETALTVAPTTAAPLTASTTRPRKPPVVPAKVGDANPNRSATTKKKLRMRTSNVEDLHSASGRSEFPAADLR